MSLRRGLRLPGAVPLLSLLDRSIAGGGASGKIDPTRLAGLRFFWFDGLFSSVSDSAYVTFVPLFALSYGASNGTIGLMAAVASLLGTFALFPGAKLLETVGWRKPIVVMSAGVIGRGALLFFILLPYALPASLTAIVLIIGLNGLRSFLGNFCNPAWTAMTADLVPPEARGRYFGSRNMVIGVAALVTAPIAGWLIHTGDIAGPSRHFGFQIVFLLSLVSGMVSTYCYNSIPEPAPPKHETRPHKPGDLRRALRTHPVFIGFVVTSCLWNLSLQVASPFFNVYIITGLHGNASNVGTATGITNLTSLLGLWLFAKLVDRRGNHWVVKITGLLIPLLPLSWILMRHPYQAYINNVFSGFLWAGFNLATFNILLDLAPPEQRGRGIALYQTLVFASAVVGPLLGGYLADVAGFRWVFFASGVGRYLGVFLFLWLVKESALPAPRGFIVRRR